MTAQTQVGMEGRSRWLRLAHIVWVSLVTLAVLLFLLGIPPRYAELVTTCNSTPSVECRSRQFSDEQANALEASGFSLAARAAFILFGSVIIALTSVITALVLFWRRSDDWVALLISLAFVAFNTDVTTIALEAVQPFWHLPVTLLSSIGSAAFPIIFYIFPDGRFVPRWTRYVLIVWVAVLTFGAFSTFIPGLPADVASAVGTVAWLGMFSGSVAAQIYRYFAVADRVQRQQTKWIVVGIALVVLIGIGSIIVEQIVQPAQQGVGVTLGFDLFNTFVNISIGVGIPLTFGIAILRYRLWDIDFLISRTVTYGLVTGLLLLVFFGSVILLQRIFVSLTGVSQNELANVLSTLAIAALFVPLRNRVQSTIDRRFNRKKYNAQQVLQDFAMTMQDETDLEKLTARLMEVVNETMQPTSVSLWLNADDNTGKRGNLLG